MLINKYRCKDCKKIIFKSASVYGSRQCEKCHRIMIINNELERNKRLGIKFEQHRRSGMLI